MGLSKGGIKLLLNESSRRPFAGRVLTLGRQDIWFSHGLLQEMANEFGVELSSPGDITFSHKPEFAEKGYMSDECLFRSLGFADSKSLDYSEYEAASYRFDLNSDDVPQHLVDAFDVIVDAGTIEHVFHIPNVLSNVHRMLRRGGRIIHLAPSSNHMDHGMYMFSPTLFWDFYEVNQFEISNFKIFRYTPRHNIDPWVISDYQPGCLDRISFGGLDNGMYGIMCVATKTRDSTGNVVPQQGGYVYNVWKSDVRKTFGTETSRTSARSKSQMIKEFIKRFPLVYQVLRLPIRLVRLVFRRRTPTQKGTGLKVVGRY